MGTGISRRHFLGRTAKAGALTLGSVLGCSHVFTAHRAAITERNLPIRGLPTPFHGVVIAHLSDFHYGPFVTRDYIRDVILTVARRNPDLVLLSGDYVHTAAREVEPLAAMLATLRPPLGMFAALGNYDFRFGYDDPLIVDQLTAAGAQVLDDRTARVDKGWAHLWIAGHYGFQRPTPVPDSDLPTLLRAAADSAPRLVLAHFPQIASVAAEAGADVVLAGHTHGGQINVPGLSPGVLTLVEEAWRGPRSPAPDAGLRWIGQTQLFVNRGIGMVGLPWRIGATPEIAFLTLSEV